MLKKTEIDSDGSSSTFQIQDRCILYKDIYEEPLTTSLDFYM